MAIAPLSHEAELILKISKGDKRAFTTLFEGYYKSLAAYIFKLTESMEVTEEIVQDVFIKVWLKRETLTGISSFSNYLFILSRNKTLNHLRKQARYSSHFQSLETELETDVRTEEENDIYEDFRLLIDDAIERLPPQQKRIYQLSRFERLKYEEIAQQLSLSAETVKKHMYLATKAIKEHVHNHMDEVVVSILLCGIFF
ncbi:RNA polymerase sigma-70 factor [Pedobacter sp. PLR]|uniref:RNA polymerase sigma factor n=1 Tax=Pedobacter sp. PLR TaxID=2994465 RepID=UPI00224843B2|nr:RNA polymerase sigma-70 factor [Pedobacter sp. PLR]MCX2451282.1 RNA polymerase sigma-70 factor [Pedobacter sp. PLR]